MGGNRNVKKQGDAVGAVHAGDKEAVRDMGLEAGQSVLDLVQKRIAEFRKKNQQSIVAAKVLVHELQILGKSSNVPDVLKTELRKMADVLNDSAKIQYEQLDSMKEMLRTKLEANKADVSTPKGPQASR